MKKQAMTLQRPPQSEMTEEQLRAWIRVTRTAWQQKMRRERTSLERRAARGTHMPSDDAYEADHLLEADLLTFLDEMEVSL